VDARRIVVVRLELRARMDLLARVRRGDVCHVEGEEMKRRQRLHDTVSAAASQFAAKLVDALVEFENGDDAPEKTETRRRAAIRTYSPANEPDSTPDEIARARAERRRAGMR
jgi:uncharacterized Ntn-hydrolase superfamily protein